MVLVLIYCVKNTKTKKYKKPKKYALKIYLTKEELQLITKPDIINGVFTFFVSNWVSWKHVCSCNQLCW